jgi:hypothetical protein
MCDFSCVVGESLRIGDFARLHIRRVVKGSDADQVLLAIEWSDKYKIPVEILPPDGSQGSGTPGVAN